VGSLQGFVSRLQGFIGPIQLLYAYQNSSAIMSKEHKEQDVLPLPELPPSQQGTSTASASNYRASVGVPCANLIGTVAFYKMHLCLQGL
jgi:hypothetical protein